MNGSFSNITLSYITPFLNAKSEDQDANLEKLLPLKNTKDDPDVIGERLQQVYEENLKKHDADTKDSNKKYSTKAGLFTTSMENVDLRTYYSLYNALFKIHTTTLARIGLFDVLSTIAMIAFLEITMTVIDYHISETKKAGKLYTSINDPEKNDAAYSGQVYHGQMSFLFLTIAVLLKIGEYILQRHVYLGAEVLAVRVEAGINYVMMKVMTRGALSQGQTQTGGGTQSSSSISTTAADNQHSKVTYSASFCDLENLCDAIRSPGGVGPGVFSYLIKVVVCFVYFVYKLYTKLAPSQSDSGSNSDSDSLSSQLLTYGSITAAIGLFYCLMLVSIISIHTSARIKFSKARADRVSFLGQALNNLRALRMYSMADQKILKNRIYPLLDNEIKGKIRVECVRRCLFLSDCFPELAFVILLLFMGTSSISSSSATDPSSDNDVKKKLGNIFVMSSLMKMFCSSVLDFGQLVYYCKISNLHFKQIVKYISGQSGRGHYSTGGNSSSKSLSNSSQQQLTLTDYSAQISTNSNATRDTVTQSYIDVLPSNFQILASQSPGDRTTELKNKYLLNNILRSNNTSSNSDSSSSKSFYSPSSSVVFNVSLKENIILSLPMNKNLYYIALLVSDLYDDIFNPEFQTFGNLKDNVMIVNGGENLSGGQKKRLNLTRVIYHGLYHGLKQVSVQNAPKGSSESSLHLVLDDPLGALDKDTAQRVARRLLEVFGNMVRMTKSQTDSSLKFKIIIATPDIQVFVEETQKLLASNCLNSHNLIDIFMQLRNFLEKHGIEFDENDHHKYINSYNIGFGSNNNLIKDIVKGPASPSIDSFATSKILSPRKTQQKSILPITNTTTDTVLTNANKTDTVSSSASKTKSTFPTLIRLFYESGFLSAFIGVIALLGLNLSGFTKGAIHMRALTGFTKEESSTPPPPPPPPPSGSGSPPPPPPQLAPLQHVIHFMFGPGPQKITDAASTIAYDIMMIRIFLAIVFFLPQVVGGSLSIRRLGRVALENVVVKRKFGKLFNRNSNDNSNSGNQESEGTVSVNNGSNNNVMENRIVKSNNSNIVVMASKPTDNNTAKNSTTTNPSKTNIKKQIQSSSSLLSETNLLSIESCSNLLQTVLGLDLYNAFHGLGAFSIPMQFVKLFTSILVFFLLDALMPGGSEKSLLLIVTFLIVTVCIIAGYFLCGVARFRRGTLSAQRQYLKARSDRDACYADIDSVEGFISGNSNTDGGDFNLTGIATLNDAKLVLLSLNQMESFQEKRMKTHISTLVHSKYVTVSVANHLILHLQFAGTLLFTFLLSTQIIQSFINDPNGNTSDSSVVSGLTMIITLIYQFNGDPTDRDELGFIPNLPHIENTLAAMGRFFEGAIDSEKDSTSSIGLNFKSNHTNHVVNYNKFGNTNVVNKSKSNGKTLQLLTNTSKAGNNSESHHNFKGHIHLSISNVSVRYEGITALKKFSLEVYQGEKILITGRSGSGKSSLFLAILGLVECDTGKVEVRNFNLVNKKNTKQSVKIAIEDPSEDDSSTTDIESDDSDIENAYNNSEGSDFDSDYDTGRNLTTRKSNNKSQTKKLLTRRKSNNNSTVSSVTPNYRSTTISVHDAPLICAFPQNPLSLDMSVYSLFEQVHPQFFPNEQINREDKGFKKRVFPILKDVLGSKISGLNSLNGPKGSDGKKNNISDQTLYKLFDGPTDVAFGKRKKNKSNNDIDVNHNDVILNQLIHTSRVLVAQSEATYHNAKTSEIFLLDEVTCGLPNDLAVELMSTLLEKLEKYSGGGSSSSGNSLTVLAISHQKCISNLFDREIKLKSGVAKVE